MGVNCLGSSWESALLRSSPCAVWPQPGQTTLWRWRNWDAPGHRQAGLEPWGAQGQWSWDLKGPKVQRQWRLWRLLAMAWRRRQRASVANPDQSRASSTSDLKQLIATVDQKTKDIGKLRIALFSIIEGIQ